MTSIALLSDHRVLARWQAAAVAEVVDAVDGSVDLIITNTSPKSKVRQALEAGAWGAFRGVQAAWWTLAGKPVPMEPIPIRSTEWGADATVVGVAPQPDGVGYRLPDAAPLLSNADIAIRFGFGIVLGEVLSAPTYGVMSYHHGDFRRYRGRPAGFWEFMNDEREVGITVQRLQETLDGGEILAEGSVSIDTAKSWGDVLTRLFAASPSLAGEAASAMTNGESEQLDDGELGELYTQPRTGDLLAYTKRRLAAI